MTAERKQPPPVNLINVDLQMLTDYYEFLKQKLLTIEKSIAAKPLDKWVTDDELLKKFGCSKRHLHDLRKGGKIKYTRGLAGFAYRIEDVDHYMMKSYSSLTPPIRTDDGRFQHKFRGR